MKTVVINLFGQPSAGKSVVRAKLFAKLKVRGFETEEVIEVAKDYVWEERHFALSCQPYLWAKSLRNLERVYGKVQVVVSDSPLLLSYFYGKKYASQYSSNLYEGILDEFRKLNSINIFVEPVAGSYSQNGRLQTEAETHAIGKEMVQMLTDLQIPFSTYLASDIDEMMLEIVAKIPEIADHPSKPSIKTFVTSVKGYLDYFATKRSLSK